MARFFIAAGSILLVAGILLLLAEKLNFRSGWIGRLPGDILIEKKNFKFYFPLTTSILLSLVLTLLLRLFGKR
jgi:hypothetical protein